MSCLVYWFRFCFFFCFCFNFVLFLLFYVGWGVLFSQLKDWLINLCFITRFPVRVFVYLFCLFVFICFLFFFCFYFLVVVLTPSFCYNPPAKSFCHNLYLEKKSLHSCTHRSVSQALCITLQKYVLDRPSNPLTL